VPGEKPVLTVFLSARGAPPVLGGGPRGLLPSYAFPENAARALAAAVGYGAWKRRERGTALALEPFARDAVRAIVDRALAGATEPRWLDGADVATMLRAAGIPYAEIAIVPPDEAVETAERVGYPLVAKAVSPGLVHKTEVGGVVIGIKSREEMADAVRRLEANLRAAGRPLESVLVQRFVPDGVEALVGVTSDPTFGPLLVCGLGGTLVELLRDVAHHLVPVTDRDAEDMLARLRTSRLLDGYRGAPPGDRPALVDVVRRVSALVEVVPELVELDLNPVKVLAPGEGAVVIDARIRLAPVPARR